MNLFALYFEVGAQFSLLDIRTEIFKMLIPGFNIKTLQIQGLKFVS